MYVTFLPLFVSFLLKVLTFPMVFDDIVLNVVFGGFLYGVSIVIALKGNASTGGTDFIALYFSSIKITKWRHTLGAALFADFIGIALALLFAFIDEFCYNKISLEGFYEMYLLQQ